MNWDYSEPKPDPRLKDKAWRLKVGFDNISIKKPWKTPVLDYYYSRKGSKA